jgi:predicted lipoprotein with Yx(FWY)xxD motif
MAPQRLYMLVDVDHRRMPMLNLFVRTTLIAAALFVAGASFAQAEAPTSAANTSKGKALVDPKGMTLYTFDKDADGKSACNGGCATSWPPFTAVASQSASGDWTIVKRDDGTTQWAYKGKPLYAWSKDAKPGDATGDGFKDVWHIAKP